MQLDEKQPLVSVVMPCYNHEKYVGQAIESVLNQTYSNIEFIVCDNGSTDHSYEVIKQYEERIDRIFHLEKNDLNSAGGLLRKAVTGDYIAFMTSDDVWEKTKLEKQMDIFKNKADVRACFTWAYTADEKLENPSSENVFRVNNRSRYEWLELLLLDNNHFAYPSAVVEKKAYLSALNQLKAFYQMSDTHLWILLLLEYEVYVVEEPLVYFRWHTSGSNCNMSTVSMDSMVRTENEHAIIIKEIIDRMDAEMFKNVFKKYMKNVQASTKEEICCEKFFVMQKLAEKKICLQSGVIEYYYKNTCTGKGKNQFIEVLQEQYDYSYLDFQDYCAHNGDGKMLVQMMQIEQLEDIIKRQQVCINGLQVAVKEDQENIRIKYRYRKYIFEKLSEEQREMMNLLFQCLDKVIVYIENIGERQGGYKEILSVVYESYEVFRILWNTFISMDMDVSSSDWDSYREHVEKKQISEEEFYNSILPFIRKIYKVLEQYV